MGTACRKRSPPWLLPPRRSRSSLLPRGSTPSGSAAPSWLLSPPSRKCGSQSRSSTSLDPELSTANVSKLNTYIYVVPIPTLYVRDHFLYFFFIFLFLISCNENGLIECPC